jgi:hypothetical protein
VVQSIFMALDWNESFLFLAVGCQKDSIPELLFRLLKQRDFVCACVCPFFDYTLAQWGVLNRTICGFPGNLEGGEEPTILFFHGK